MKQTCNYLDVFFSPVTVADYADADPAVVKSGRVKKAVANAVEKEGNSRTCTLRPHMNDLRYFILSGKGIQVLMPNCCISVKLLCGLEASQGAVEEVLSSAVSVKADALDSSDDLDPEEDGGNETKVARKKKNKRRKGKHQILLKV